MHAFHKPLSKARTRRDAHQTFTLDDDNDVYQQKSNTSDNSEPHNRDLLFSLDVSGSLGM